MNRRAMMMVQEALRAPWLMDPRYLETTAARMVRILKRGMQEHDHEEEPEPLTIDDLVVGRIAVLPLEGMMIQRFGQCPGCYPATYTEMWGDVLESLVADPEVAGIVIDAHSPGGIIYGVQEISDRIRALRGTKPIFAIANSLAASAGYWAATAAERLYVTPGGEVGSVGVYMMHTDISKLMEEWGVTVSFIHAGEFKVEGNMFEPLSDEARAEFQRSVDESLDAFVVGLSTNLGVDEDRIRKDFGRGRVVSAVEAVRRGMAYGVATREEVIAECARAAGVPVAGAIEGRGMSDAGVEVRSFSSALTADDDTWALEGDGIVYGQESQDLGGWREVFEVGSIRAASLEHPDARVLWQHDKSKVFGRVKAGTARFWVEGGAVRYAANPPDAQWARDAMMSIDRGDVDQSSFGFRVMPGGVRWERRDGYDLRIISDAQIVEAGPQTFPAYADTSVAVREREAWLARSAPVAGPPASDDVLMELEVMEAELGII